jgi:hypothetical protein
MSFLLGNNEDENPRTDSYGLCSYRDCQNPATIAAAFHLGGMDCGVGGSCEEHIEVMRTDWGSCLVHEAPFDPDQDYSPGEFGMEQFGAHLMEVHLASRTN